MVSKEAEDGHDMLKHPPSGKSQAKDFLLAPGIEVLGKKGVYIYISIYMHRVSFGWSCGRRSLIKEV